MIVVSFVMHLKTYKHRFEPGDWTSALADVRRLLEDGSAKKVTVYKE